MRTNKNWDGSVGYWKANGHGRLKLKRARELEEEGKRWGGVEAVWWVRITWEEGRNYCWEESWRTKAYSEVSRSF